MILILYLLIGAFAGTLAGLFGVGGGMIVVPLLATIFKHNGFPHNLVMHFAAGTSLAIMMVTSLSSLRAHIKLGNDIRPIFQKLVPGLILGTITGAILADFLHSQVLQYILGFLLLGVAFRTYFVTKIPTREHPVNSLVLSLACYVCGTISGMLGIGGGALIIPLLMYFNVNIRLAVAVSTACSFTIAIVGTIMFIITGANEIHTLQWTTGYIYWPAFLGVALATPIFASYGAKLSHRLPVLFLRRLFSYIVLIVGIKLLVY